ncbi:coiled-coil domain-containing protein 112 [Latimeria chalumnae]|uniref:Coiled-coil domain containing 112 n=1 Tax=Latimeria chalumnae TaxID=7897 RepID=H3ASH9_LATCH|nr:PREDICTED: coiled-coil domain-containing protein 112 [Latimeria chalumnae]|eukprot:XP_005992131.1 PREDICTED: coiled-coil domain-containing protein 112 [Latimeria chalumnae]
MAALTTTASVDTCRQDAGDFCPSRGHIQGFHNQNWKVKAEQAKKAEFIREAEKLKNQVANIEKDKNLHLYHGKHNFRTEYATLEEVELKLASSRKTEELKIQQQLAKIHNGVKRFQRQLKDVKPTPEFVEKLREMMEEVENAISAFKEEQRQIYEEILKEEKTSANEISVLEKKIERWTLAAAAVEVAAKQPLTKVTLAKTIQNDLPGEVVEFEKFLQQTGGRQGGWDDYDHQNFLKVWTKHRGKKSFMEEALQYLPGRTQEDIKQHEGWYQEFLFLEEQKKEAIQKWKTKKQQEKEKVLRKKENSEEEMGKRRQLHEEARQQRLEEEMKERQAQLQAWKKQKELEIAQEEECQYKEREEKLKKDREERQRQLEVKLVVEEYTRQKKEQEEFLHLEKEMREEAEKEERKKLAAKEISKFQERDLQKLKFKLLEKQAKEEREAEKERRLAKMKETVEACVNRDPSRLWQPTKGWEERLKEKGSTAGGPMLHIPHRAIPTWRQGL